MFYVCLTSLFQLLNQLAEFYETVLLYRIEHRQKLYSFIAYSQK